MITNSRALQKNGQNIVFRSVHLFKRDKTSFLGACIGIKGAKIRNKQACIAI